MVAAEALASGCPVVVPSHHPLAGRPGTFLYAPGMFTYWNDDESPPWIVDAVERALLARLFMPPGDFTSVAVLDAYDRVYGLARERFHRQHAELRAMVEGGP